MISKTERQLQEYLKRQALNSGIGFDKLESRSRAGFPDVMLYFHGQIVFVELKSARGTGRLTRLQEICHAKMRAHGLEVRVVDSVVGVNTLIAEMERWRRGD